LKSEIHQYNETKGQMNWHFVSFCPPLCPICINWSTSNREYFYHKLYTRLCNAHRSFYFFCHGFNNVKPLILSNYGLDHLKVVLAQRLLILELVDSVGAIYESIKLSLMMEHVHYYKPQIL